MEHYLMKVTSIFQNKRSFIYFPGLQLALGLWQLVPRCQASDPASPGQGDEGQSGLVRLERANSKRSAAVLLGADRALPLVSELRRTVLESGNNIFECCLFYRRDLKL